MKNKTTLLLIAFVGLVTLAVAIGSAAFLLLGESSDNAAVVELYDTITGRQYEDSVTQDTNDKVEGDDETNDSIANTATCPADSFPDITAHSRNGAYPDPELSASCQGDNLVVTSNNIPNFEFIQTTPNELLAQDYTWTVPINPTVASSTTDVPLLGTVAFTINGLAIFGPTEAPNDGYRDPYLDGLLDFCNGHTAPGGVYHMHAPPECIVDDWDKPGTVVGYALDGFPILTPYECANDSCSNVTELESSYRQVESVYGASIENAWDAHEYVNGRGDLDECNGKYDENGDYHYYATATFPYIIGCYRGEVDLNNQGGVIGNGGGQGQQPQGQGQQIPPRQGNGQLPPPPGQGQPPQQN